MIDIASVIVILPIHTQIEPLGHHHDPDIVHRDITVDIDPAHDPDPDQDHCLVLLVPKRGGILQN